MGKIVVSENMTLDGVVQDPTGDEGFARGGWFNEMTDQDRAEWARIGLADARAAEALLMGRRSDEYFAERWLAREGDWADRLNAMPKYVVSSTIQSARWTNATVLSGEVARDVAGLKGDVDGEILVIASRPLVQALMEHDLVDELRLIVYPVVLGSGEKLFAGTVGKTDLGLTGVSSVGDTLVRLVYERVHAAAPAQDELREGATAA